MRRLWLILIAVFLVAVCLYGGRALQSYFLRPPGIWIKNSSPESITIYLKECPQYSYDNNPIDPSEYVVAMPPNDRIFIELHEVCPCRFCPDSVELIPWTEWELSAKRSADSNPVVLVNDAFVADQFPAAQVEIEIVEEDQLLLPKPLE